MNEPTPMRTLTEVLNTLRGRGISEEFRMNEKGEMRLAEEDKVYEPKELTILKSYRFEGDSSPDDNAVLYIAKDSSGKMGFLLDTYGADSNYSGDEFDKFLREIPIEEDDSLEI